MGNTVVKAGRAVSTWEKLRGLLKFGSISIFIVILILYALLVSLRTGDITPALYEIGGKTLGVTKALSDLSLKIIAQQGVYDDSEGKLKGIWDAVLTYALLFGYLMLAWFYINLLAKGYEKTISDSTSWFRNILLGFMTFLVFQAMYLIIFEPRPEAIGNVQLAATPLKAFFHFGQSLYYILDPVVQGIKTIEGSEIVNKTIERLS
jgi:hypothetical protein